MIGVVVLQTHGLPVLQRQTIKRISRVRRNHLIRGEHQIHGRIQLRLLSLLLEILQKGKIPRLLPARKAKKRKSHQKNPPRRKIHTSISQGGLVMRMQRLRTTFKVQRKALSRMAKWMKSTSYSTNCLETTNPSRQKRGYLE